MKWPGVKLAASYHKSDITTVTPSCHAYVILYECVILLLRDAIRVVKLNALKN